MIQNGNGTGFISSMESFLFNYGLMMLCMIIGTIICSALVYTLMQTYDARENRLSDIEFKDISSLLKKNMIRCITVIFTFLAIYLLFIVVVVLLAYLSSVYTLFLTIPLFLIFILLLIPLMQIFPVCLFERDLRLAGAIKKAWKFGIATFGGMILLMFVLNIIASVIQSVTMMPWYLTVIIRAVFSLSQETPALDNSIIYKFSVYILGIIQSFGIYISSIIGLIGIAFQYFHAREKVEGVTIESNIENFNKL
jgi:hypothetical protein